MAYREESCQSWRRSNGEGWRSNAVDLEVGESRRDSMKWRRESKTSNDIIPKRRGVNKHHGGTPCKEPGRVASG